MRVLELENSGVHSIPEKLDALVLDLEQVKNSTNGVSDRAMLTNYIGRDGLSQNVEDILKGLSYDVETHSPANYAGAEFRVFRRITSPCRTAMLVDNKHDERFRDMPGGLLPDLHYLLFLEIDSADVDKYIQHTRQMTVSNQRSTRYWLTHWAIPLGFTAAAMGSWGNDEQGLVFSLGALLSAAVPRAWNRFQKTIATGNLYQATASERRSGGYQALLDALTVRDRIKP